MTLIERIEQAEGPSRELDAEIAAAVGVKHGPDSAWCNSDNGDYWSIAECAPPFTSSIDAALTLVPRLRAWRVTSWPRTSQAGAKVENGPECAASTPALSLCLAALRAREQAPDTAS